MQRPQVIFLDAAGTLFGVKGGVGEIYRQIAARFGVEVSAERLDRAFIQCFQAASPLTFPRAEIDRVPDLEFQWWRALAGSAFARAGYFDRFTDFEAFFRYLYDYFATADAWRVYGDVLPALQYWRDRGVELGIISNFDSRLYPLLKRLELDRFFQTITLSSIAGAAKPDPVIFQTALQKHACPADRAWHIGDSRSEDYEGAKAVGIQAFWLDRSR